MHIKFLKHGRGSGRKAVKYLLGTHDHNGVERAEVRVLRGDPELVGQVADSLEFVHRYTSGVIAWSPDDKPGDDQIEHVLEDFARVAFAGLDPSRVAHSAILHVDKDGSRHVHVLTARVDLMTGKSLNVAPPGWEKSYDPLRDMHNYRWGWARPDDPARQRSIPVSLTAAEFRGLFERGREKEQITAFLMEAVLAGRIRDRAGVVGALEGFGEITRQGKDYVSVRIAGHDKPFRMKGPIYGADFDPTMADELIVDDHADRHGLLEVSSEPDPEKEEIARAEMEAAIEKRAAYNEKRYPVPPPAAPAPVPTKKLKKPEVIHDGNRTLIARLAEEFDQRIRRTRAAIRSAFERFGGALGRYDRASERYDEQLSELVESDSILIESTRRYEQRQRGREEVDLDAAMNQKRPGPGSSSGPRM